MSRPRKNPLTVALVCENCSAIFEAAYAKRYQRFCCRSCSQSSSLVQAKIRESQLETCRSKYGVDHPMMVQSVVDKFKSTMMKNHGVEHALQKKSLLDKCKITSEVRHGDSNYRNVQQRKKTCLEKYGVDNFVKTEDYRSKYKSTCLEKYGTDHASKSRVFTLEHTKTMFDKFLTHDRFVNFTPMFQHNEYFGVLKDTSVVKYKFKCKRCNNIDSYNLNNGNPIHCVNCDKSNTSYFQKDVYDYVKSLLGVDVLVSMNDRITLRPQELDIYIPSLNLAIECNGIYWHSEVIGGKNKIYHLNKTNRCKNVGINLIHVFENEWNMKRDVVKSILQNIIGKSSIRIPARKCEVKYVTNSEVDAFLSANHIQGPSVASVKIGLYHAGRLVSLMTFGKSRFDKDHEWEMVRYCNLLNHSVIGSASKLFSFFLKMNQPKSIVSYSDRRYFSGKIYSSLGFSFVSMTDPNYWYVMDGYKSLKNRMSFQKHKLKSVLSNFDPTITEWENMKLNGYDRIWDCGNSKWSYKSS